MSAEIDSILTQREKRFDVANLSGFEAIVSRPASEESVYFAEIVDISRTGAKFSLPFSAKFDELLEIKFKFKNADLNYFGEGRVRHIRNIEENRWHVGCSLDPPLPDEVVAFLARNTNQERRRSERVEIEGEGRLIQQGNIGGSVARLVNISKGGVCLFVEEEQPVGQRVEFEIDNARGQTETIAIRIRWQSPYEDGFRIGCSFAEASCYDVLVQRLVEAQDDGAAENLNWLVLAVAVMVMSVPTIWYFLNGHGNENQRANSGTTVVARVADDTADSVAGISPRNAGTSSDDRNPAGEVGVDEANAGTAAAEEFTLGGADIEFLDPDSKDSNSDPAVADDAVNPTSEKSNTIDQRSSREPQSAAGRMESPLTGFLPGTEGSNGPKPAVDSGSTRRTFYSRGDTSPARTKKRGTESQPPLELVANRKQSARSGVNNNRSSSRRTRQHRDLEVPFEVIEK